MPDDLVFFFCQSYQQFLKMKILKKKAFFKKALKSIKRAKQNFFVDVFRPELESREN